MTDYLKNIGNRYLPSLSLIRTIYSFKFGSVSQRDVIIGTNLQMIEQFHTRANVNACLLYTSDAADE